MYDFLKVELQLPGTRAPSDKDIAYQTKSLSNTYKIYTISSGGELYTETTEDSTLLREYLTDFSGEITFTLDGSNSYTATFENGRIRKLSYTRNK